MFLESFEAPATTSASSSWVVLHQGRAEAVTINSAINLPRSCKNYKTNLVRPCNASTTAWCFPLSGFS